MLKMIFPSIWFVTVRRQVRCELWNILKILFFILFLSSPAFAQVGQPTFSFSVSDDDTTVYNPWNIGFNGAEVTQGSGGSALVTITGGVLASTDIDTSAELAAILTDEVGTGFAVFSDSPVFTTQITTPKILSSSGLNLDSDNDGVNEVTISSGGQVNVNFGTLKFTNVTAPTAATVAVNAAAGNLTGTYNYKITYVTAVIL